MSHSNLREAYTLSLVLSLLVLSGCSPVQRSLADLSPVEREAAESSRARGEAAASPDILNSAELRPGTKTRIEELLVARIPGVRVLRTGNDGFTIRIRGTSSFRSAGEPLFIVDGVELTAPASNTLRYIKPRDVQSIQVIKDGMASAYGVRGASGVILISTVAMQ